MCGFAGVVRSEGPIQNPDGIGQRLDESLAHRGPDGHGRWLSSDRQTLLVHRRLAIIDTGAGSAQPMASLDGGHQIVFNGEIYNYRELRRTLEARGERFSTSGDTEVLLRLVMCDGPAALSRVRGMFAFACWNASDRSLLLARDRFGMKPLYCAWSARDLAFASEISALLAGNLARRDVSPAGVLAFLSWGSVPSPLTWIENIHSLLPGTWLRWREGKPERGVFADTRSAYLENSVQVAVAELRNRVAVGVRDSVAAHLVADVPVGVFLSGGIDSGAIVSAASAAGATNLQTFTVGFGDAPDSESSYARDVARLFGTSHHELTIAGRHVATDFPSMLTRLDQPSIDGVNSFYVSRAVAATGVKAVLSGVGGDELFGGYPSFSRIPRALAVKRAAGPAWPPLARLGDQLMAHRLKARWRHFAETNGSLVEAYRVQRGFLMPAEIESLAGPALRDSMTEAASGLRAAEDQQLAPLGAEPITASIARLEGRLYLGSQLLRDIDVMGMAHGLEVRAPFVDHELLGLVWPALGATPALQRGKRLLFESLARPLPAAIVRRPKQGFVLPFDKWIGSDLAPLVRDGLSRCEASGWLAREAGERVWKSWQAGTTHWTRPWGLAVLGHFLDAAR